MPHNRDLGFAPADRTENVRRVGEVAALMSDSGTITIASLISPYRKDRDMVKSYTKIMREYYKNLFSSFLLHMIFLYDFTYI